VRILLFLIMACVILNSFGANHEEVMRRLIPLAKENPQAPFAAAIVDTKTGKILCTGLNDSISDPTWHGEMRAISKCAKIKPAINWQRSTLYTTAEPCPMCAGAIVWSGIPTIVYGTSIATLQKLGWHQLTINAQYIIDHNNFYHGKIIPGVLQQETDKLFRRNNEIE
jgi:tRNA(adenine34) deaminase